MDKQTLRLPRQAMWKPLLENFELFPSLHYLDPYPIQGRGAGACPRHDRVEHPWQVACTLQDRAQTNILMDTLTLQGNFGLWEETRVPGTEWRTFFAVRQQRYPTVSTALDTLQMIRQSKLEGNLLSIFFDHTLAYSYWLRVSFIPAGKHFSVFTYFTKFICVYQLSWRKNKTVTYGHCLPDPITNTVCMFCLLKAALKKYQMEHKSKGESLEKCHGELKKLRRKSQGSKNPSKYNDKELQVRRLEDAGPFISTLHFYMMGRCMVDPLGDH